MPPLLHEKEGGKEGGRGHNRAGGLLGTRGKLVGWNDGTASVSNQGPKEGMECTFLAKVTKQHKSNES